VSGGLHGVGVSVVNALSETLDLTIARDGKRFFSATTSGAEAPCPIGTRRPPAPPCTSAEPKIFTHIDFHYEILGNACANSRSSTRVSRSSEGRARCPSDTFEVHGGIRAFVEHLNRNKVALHRPSFTSPPAETM